MSERRKLDDVAYLIIASWLLGAQATRIPTSGGVLDRALYMSRDSLPPWAREQLHFSDLRAGLRCPELPRILDFAQDALLTVAPNPTYHYTDIQVSEWNALDLLRELEVPPEEAKRIGETLKREAESAMSRRIEDDSLV